MKKWTPKLHSVAEGLIRNIHEIAPELEVLFMGAGALGLPGKNDIDLDILCSTHDLKHYADLLTPVMGNPQITKDNIAVWNYEYKGYEIDALLSDPSAPNSHVPKQIKVYETLRSQPNLLEQYRQLKREWDGLPLYIYKAKKKDFLEQIANT